MKHRNCTIAAIVGGLAHGMAAAQADTKAGLADFLADSSGSYVGAGGIIGLDGQVVRDTASPKDFVASVNAIRRKDAKDGVGVAFTPGRARFEKLVVDLSAIPQPKSPAEDRLLVSPWRRLWGATTFSYAQKRADVEGAGEYRFWSYAVNSEYYWNLKDDPAFAAYAVFDKDSSCERARQLTQKDAAKLSEALKQVRLWATESALAEAKAAAASGGVASADVAKAAADKQNAKSLEDDLAACVSKASDKAAEKWNAPKLTALWGRGQLQSTAANSPRHSLGTHFQVAASLSPDYPFTASPQLKNSLLTASYKRTSNAVDASTLATTPVFKTYSLAAIRYTHAFAQGGEPSATKGGITSYLLAEVSNAKSSQGGVAAGTYKQALGWDYRLGANMWLELRHGRAVAQTGDKYETKSMLTLKLSPETALAALMPKP